MPNISRLINYTIAGNSEKYLLRALTGYEEANSLFHRIKIKKNKETNAFFVEKLEQEREKRQQCLDVTEEQEQILKKMEKRRLKDDG